MEAAGPVDAQSGAHRAFENHKAGFQQLPQALLVAMLKEEDRKR